MIESMGKYKKQRLLSSGLLLLDLPSVRCKDQLQRCLIFRTAQWLRFNTCHIKKAEVLSKLVELWKGKFEAKILDWTVSCSCS